MFDHNHYVPVLKGKRAEFPALREVSTKDWLTPLVEPVPNANIETVPQSMARAWPRERPFFVDGVYLEGEDAEYDEESADQHPIRLCFNAVATGNLRAIPVTGTGRSPGYQQAVTRIVRDQRQGYGIRLVIDDFDDEEQLEEALRALVDYHELDRGSIDLFVDLGSVADGRAATTASMMRANISLLPNSTEWRTLTVLAGAFPLGLAPLARDTWNLADRSDWSGWNRVIRRPDQIPRLPAYGDYTIAHPELPPTGRATVLGQLRYTTPDSFLIWKGRNVFTDARGFGQFIEICRSLVARPEYRGRGFSWGDAEIYEKAANGGSPGNAETWRRIGVNHHLETVREQLASLPSP